LSLFQADALLFFFYSFVYHWDLSRWYVYSGLLCCIMNMIKNIGIFNSRKTVTDKEISYYFCNAFFWIMVNCCLFLMKKMPSHVSHVYEPKKVP